MAGWMSQNQPFSGIYGDFRVCGTGAALPCLDIPSCPRAGRISVLGFPRRLLSPHLPCTPGWRSDPQARAAWALVSSLCTAGMDQEEEAAAQPRPCCHRTACHLLFQQPLEPLPLRAMSWAGVLLKTSFITATRKCQCLCCPDKSLLLINTVTCCKQHKL